MAYPISHGRLVNVAFFSTNYPQEGAVHPEPWVSQADPREISRLFNGWETDVQDLVAVSKLSIDPADPDNLLNSLLWRLCLNSAWTACQ